MSAYFNAKMSGPSICQPNNGAQGVESRILNYDQMGTVMLRCCPRCFARHIISRLFVQIVSVGASEALGRADAPLAKRRRTWACDDSTHSEKLGL